MPKARAGKPCSSGGPAGIRRALPPHTPDLINIAMPDYRTAPLRPLDLRGAYTPAPGPEDVAANRRVPTTVVLNTRDWFDVLYFVNRFATQYGAGERMFALKAEHLIHQQLPAGVRYCRHIEDWLLQHWGLGGSHIAPPA